MSSLSLPVFNRKRLRHALIKLNKQQNQNNHIGNRGVSESELVTACLILFLTKRKNYSTGLQPFEKTYRATRQYNEDRYSYEKVTTNVSITLWRMLQLRAVEMKVSLSQLADLALRQYLSLVVARIERPGTPPHWEDQPWVFPQMREKKQPKRRAWAHLIRAGGREWLNHLIQSCSYQTILKKENIAGFTGGQPAEFLFGYRLTFGITPHFRQQI